MIAVCTCLCGSVESLARDFLKSVGYKDWLNIPIHRGKEKSLSLLNQFPPSSEKDMLRNFLDGATKWVVIIGYDDQNMKWSDIVHNSQKSRIEAEFVVKNFSIDK